LARRARVAEQAAAEENAVGDKAGERASALTPAGDDEHDDKRAMEEQADRDGEKRPRQELHSPRLAARVPAITRAKRALPPAILCSHPRASRPVFDVAETA
jgi:hypothetical protein